MAQWLTYLMDFDSITGYIWNLQSTHYSKLSMEYFTYFYYGKWNKLKRIKHTSRKSRKCVIPVVCAKLGTGMKSNTTVLCLTTYQFLIPLVIWSRYVLMFTHEVLRCTKASSNLPWHSRNAILIPKKTRHNWIIPKFCCFAVAKTNHTQKKKSLSCPVSPWKTHHHKDDTVTAELYNLHWKKIFI